MTLERIMPKARKRETNKRKIGGFDPVPGGYVDPLNEWDRPHLPALDIPAGAFEAWVAATDAPPTPGTRGPSACSWEIRRKGEADQIVPEQWPGRPNESDESKAYVAVVAGVLDRLPIGSTVEVCCRAKWVVDAIEGDLDKWESNGELDGKRARRYAKIWSHILVRRKQITSNPRDISARRPTEADEKIIERLMNWARDRRPQMRRN